jgi:hypothetical protein
LIDEDADEVVQSVRTASKATLSDEINKIINGNEYETIIKQIIPKKSLGGNNSNGLTERQVITKFYNKNY